MRRLKLNTLRLIAMIAVAPAAAAHADSFSPQRQFPTSWDHVQVFVDQLDGGLTTAQKKFAASHYAGTCNNKASRPMPHDGCSNARPRKMRPTGRNWPHSSRGSRPHWPGANPGTCRTSKLSMEKNGEQYYRCCERNGHQTTHRGLTRIG